MAALNRRNFVRAVGATCLANALHFSNAEERHNAQMPRLGVVAKLGPGETADVTIKRVHALGFSSCQIFFEHLTLDDAKPLLEALSKYGVEVSAVSEHNPGPRIFNFYQGPLTVGIVPPANPNHRARIQALKLAADFAHRCNVPSVHTHLGFIPEDPNDPIYPQAIASIREVAAHCKEQGRMLLAETGEDTPITMLRMIQDVGANNIYVNLDTANLILCGKGNPVDAMDVFGHLVRGVHAKDGLFPTDPRNFGKEVPIGQGRVDFPALFKRFKDVNYTGAITIEREIEGPRQTTDILQSKIFLQDLITKTYTQG
jgi:sugar phosphate isomerase/epimerase